MTVLRRLFISAVLLFALSLHGYSQREKLYDTNADGLRQFESAVEQASKEHKHVMLQIGGNWCSWCYKFHDFYKNDAKLDSVINANYVVVRINYDKSNKNERLLANLGYPQRFGFPVIVICDAEGRRLHTQNSWYLEDGKGSYDREKFLAFLKNWTVRAVSPESYK
ncbi:MAG: thioredoxin family protein [Chlorobi bacterium]|nr:thioredoxin family protein [Chlorobiota bacterium]